MRRFHWPLERLLDVTAQREQALRSRVLALAQHVAGLRQQRLRRREALQKLLHEMGRQDLADRVASQHLLGRCLPAHERAMADLEARLAAAEKDRSQRMQELLRARASRKTLQRLRAEALRRHLRQQALLEQKQFDEVAHVAAALRGRLATSRAER